MRSGGSPGEGERLELMQGEGLFLLEDARVVSSRSNDLFVRELGGGFDRDELDEVHARVRERVGEDEIVASAGPGSARPGSGAPGSPGPGSGAPGSGRSASGAKSVTLSG